MNKEINKYEEVSIRNDIRDKDIEIWKHIKGYEDIYQISNYGRIKALNYNNSNISKLRALGTRDGYNVIVLFNYNIKSFSINRLVYSHFIGTLIDGLIIDHIDNIRNNNYYKNLQQISRRENVSKDTWRKSKISKYIGVTFNNATNNWKSAIRIKGKVIHIGNFNNEEDARDAYINVLSNGMTNKYKYNRNWNVKDNINAQSKVFKAVIQYDLSNNELDRFKSVSAASRILKVATGSISRSCKTNVIVKKKWIFKYDNPDRSTNNN